MGREVHRVGCGALNWVRGLGRAYRRTPLGPGGRHDGRAGERENPTLTTHVCACVCVRVRACGLSCVCVHARVCCPLCGISWVGYADLDAALAHLVQRGRKHNEAADATLVGALARGTSTEDAAPVSTEHRAAAGRAVRCTTPVPSRPHPPRAGAGCCCGPHTHAHTHTLHAALALEAASLCGVFAWHALARRLSAGRVLAACQPRADPVLVDC